MSNGLFELFYDTLPVGPSQTLPGGRRSRGWTLRTDRLNASASRFDWIHGTTDETGRLASSDERADLRQDVLDAAARVARAHGYLVKADGIGLTIVAPATKRGTTR